MNTKKIIVFDGVCKFCSFWVKFAYLRNQKKDIYFMHLQNENAKEMLENKGLNINTLNSVVFLNQEKMYTQSSAMFQICKNLDGLWKLLFVFYFIPKPLRDLLYNWIAKNRYRWFGKHETCFVPTNEFKKQFI